MNILNRIKSLIPVKPLAVSRSAPSTVSTWAPGVTFRDDKCDFIASDYVICELHLPNGDRLGCFIGPKPEAEAWATAHQHLLTGEPNARV